MDVATLASPRVSSSAAAMAVRAEVDTSAPFESVKEAVDRFGGSAQWKSQLKQLFQPQSQKHHTAEDANVMIVEEQAAQLQKDLIAKERETLDVLKELEMTKRIVDELKLKLQREASEVSEISDRSSDDMKVHPIAEIEEHFLKNPENQLELKQSPGLILMELKQAKLNLNRTTTDLAGIRASVDLLTSKIENEKALLEKTREKLASNTALVSSLEKELDQTKNLRAKTPEQLSSEIEQFRKLKEASKSEISQLTSEIEQTKSSIKTAEIRLFAARKMEEAAKAAKAVALAETKALTNETPSEKITLSIGEYNELTRKAKEADELSKKRIEATMVEMEEANQSNLDLLLDVEKAENEVKKSRKLLDEALIRVETANRRKLAVEEALRRWRSEMGQKRRHVQNSPKFKNAYSNHHRRDSRMLDLNGLSLTRPTLSIGQILGQKLTGPEDYDVWVREKINVKPKVSLGQMLSKQHRVLSPRKVDEDCNGMARKQYSAKRKKFGLVSLTLLKAKRSKKAMKNKNTKEAWSPR